MTTTTDKPWENPQVGDVLTMRDGRKRTLIHVTRVFSSEWVRWTGMGPTGRRVTSYCLLSSWRTRACVESAKGGSYEARARLMTERFEDRHRAVREALAWTTEDAVAYRRRQADVRQFDERTGPLVDDLVVAVRQFDAFPNERLRTLMRQKLAALDEASSR